jgi:hypothetical protein
MKKEKIFKELARDFLALGSIPFFLIVVVRVFIAPIANYQYSLLVSLVVIFIVTLFFKNQDYLARGVVLLFFTSLYYNDNVYTNFVRIVWVLMVFSSYYLKRDNLLIVKGILLGVVATAIGYLVI